MALPTGVTYAELLPYISTVALASPDQTYATFLLEGVCDYAAEHTGRQLVALDNGTDDVNVTVKAELGEKSRWFRLPDARIITSVTRSDDSSVLVEDTDYQTHTVGDKITSISLLTPAAKLVIAGKFGFTTVPLELRDAIYAQTARHYRERDAMYADQVELPEGGQVNFFRQLVPRVKLTYDRYRLPSIG